MMQATICNGTFAIYKEKIHYTRKEALCVLLVILLAGRVVIKHRVGAVNRKKGVWVYILVTQITRLRFILSLSYTIIIMSSRLLLSRTAKSIIHPRLVRFQRQQQTIHAYSTLFFIIIIMDSIIVDLLQLPTYYQLSEPPSFRTASLLPLKRTQHRRQLQWVYGSMQDPVLSMSKTTDQLTFSNTWHSRYTLTMCLYNPLCC